MKRRFKRATESNIPGYVEKTFFKDEIEQPDDPFAQLKSEHESREKDLKTKLASYDSERQGRDWKKANEPKSYKRPSFANKQDDDFQTYADMKSNSIFRSNYDTDEDLSARSTTDGIQLTDPVEQMRHFAMYGADSNNPDIEEAIKTSMYDNLRQKCARLNIPFDETSPLESIYADIEQAEKNISLQGDKNHQWQQEQIKSARIRERKMSEARLSPLLKKESNIVRTGQDSVVDNSFGLPNYENMVKHEEERFAVAQRAREERKAIKREEVDVHQDWESNLDLDVKTTKSLPSWMEDFAE